MQWFAILSTLLSLGIPFTGGKTLELNSPTTYVGVLSPIPEMSSLTACLWVKTSGPGPKMSLVSYAVSGSDNEFVMYPAAGLFMFVKGSKVSVGLKVDDSQWHHVCATWSSNGGNWAYYDNGAVFETGSGLKNGRTITGGGSLVLGQEQDRVGGGFSSSQALIGSITGFNVWSKTLSVAEVANVYKDCSIGGDVYAWDISNLEITGDVTESQDGVCDDTAVYTESPEGGKTLVLTSTDTFVRVLRPIPAMAAVTACLWVKTSPPGTKATLVSYAASTHHNEFVMYPAASLMLYVKGTKLSADLNVADGQWHHVCATWSSNGGNWAYYDNGAVFRTGSGLRSGNTITGGGIITLGQVQDKVGGKLDPTQALIGSITGFNLWSRALRSDEVAAVFNDCSIGGDVFSWDLSDLQITGDVTRSSDGVCDDTVVYTKSPEGGKTLVLTSTDTFVRVLRPIPAMAAVTACLWVKTSPLEQKLHWSPTPLQPIIMNLLCIQPLV
ncbi:uncharacterized protein [Ptychodera flava]|uniref:uncharacterized protein isoform X1 n=2 Tax=Ptychodera flava TaxID=63121 RepID=UPI00396A0E2D